MFDSTVDPLIMFGYGLSLGMLSAALAVFTAPSVIGIVVISALYIGIVSYLTERQLQS